LGGSPENFFRWTIFQYFRIIREKNIVSLSMCYFYSFLVNEYQCSSSTKERSISFTKTLRHQACVTSLINSTFFLLAFTTSLIWFEDQFWHQVVPVSSQLRQSPLSQLTFFLFIIDLKFNHSHLKLNMKGVMIIYISHEQPHKW
jgi:hypothetical protein